MKRLLVIDSLVSPRSPAMRGWLKAAPEVLPQRFDEVEIWGFGCDLTAPWVRWQKVRPVSSRWAIQSLFYERAIRHMIMKLPRSYCDETLIQCTGTHLPKVDIRFIHFWNNAFAAAAASRPHFLKLPLKDKIFGPGIMKAEAEALRPGNTGEWWCVSRGIAAPIVQNSPSPPIIRLLPNTYDPVRFNHSTRNKWHEAMRTDLNFSKEDIVLGFSAFGHFERKGLRQAVQVIEMLRNSGFPVKLLVLGGDTRAIRTFRTTMQACGISLDGIHFAGLVTTMEKYLSAADAFFMPSHFEAFSLAEIEAAALGLRLYLTAHPGHEMILRENNNGRLLPWEPEGMAEIIRQEIQTGIIGIPHYELGEALTADSYARTMGSHYDAAISRKWG
jgi:Glycosyltransferase